MITQELILSRRVVHFCRHQVFWECAERIASEIFPLGVPRSSNSKLTPSLPPIKDVPITGFNPWYQSRDLYSHWDSIVRRYTSTELTYPGKDKLVALSGVARAIGLKDLYLAGLWRGDLQRQLLWSSDRTSNRMPVDYQAPTWSWACLNIPVTTRRSVHNLVYVAEKIRNPEGIVKEEVLISIVQASMELKDPTNEFGAIKNVSGRIVLRGQLLYTHIDGFDGIYGRIFSMRCKILFDCKQYEPSSSSSSSSDMYFLPVIWRFGSDYRGVHGLVLQRSRSEPGIFYRRGYFDTMVRMEKEEFLRFRSRIVATPDREDPLSEEYVDLQFHPDVKDGKVQITLM